MLIYNLVVFIYGSVIRLAALRKHKARLWVEGRKNWRRNFERALAGFGEERILIHCASYGEFEQGRPLIDALKKKYPAKKIILSFFSPSGYEEFKNYAGADLVIYLPLDLPANARDFVRLIDPELAIFIKYEFWINLLFELKRHNIPTYLVSATFKPHHPFFRPYGGIFRRSLSAFKTMFLQDQRSAELLNAADITNHVVIGDTRFDRVLEISKKKEPVASVEIFCKGAFTMVAGSTWPGDEKLLCDFIKTVSVEDFKMVLVPHHVDEVSIAATKKLLDGHQITYRTFSDDAGKEARVLIVDRMGLLSAIYQYADCAYVGGGFNGGLHNTLEPAVYGIPVFFYFKHYHKYNEAVEMEKRRLAFPVKNAEQLAAQISAFKKDPNQKDQLKKNMSAYFAENADITGRILERLGKELKIKT